MEIIIVDDERILCNELVSEVSGIVPKAAIEAFTNPDDALDHFRGNDGCDIAFLDVSMPGMSGLALAREMTEIYPMVNIIFVTAYSEYALDAHSVYASDYILKPFSTDDITRALTHLRHPVQKRHALQVKCFGSFAVSYLGEPVEFRSSRTKEILAYLIKLNGSRCNMYELHSMLWEGRPVTDSSKSRIRTLIADLRGSLDKLGMGDVVEKHRDSIRINTDMIDCDYYDYLIGDPAARESFDGRFMEQYPWAKMQGSAK